jgi:hypothetical protein
MHAFASTSGAVAEVREGTLLRAGDGIRFVLEPSGFPYVMIGSIDGAGQATVYYPYGGRESVRLGGGATIEVPGSIELDDAPGPERIFALFSEEPLSGERVDDELRAIGKGGPEAIRRARGQLLPAVAQSSVLIEKATP